MTKTVFAYYNEKGGVGKTSSVLSMLYFFNSMKLFKRAVAIDMDPQRSLTLLSGCQMPRWMSMLQKQIRNVKNMRAIC